MDEKVFQAVTVLERFRDLYKVDDEWIDNVAEFAHSKETFILNDLRTRRMNAFVINDASLCDDANIALDVAMKFLYGEYRKKKGERDEVSIKKVGAVCYKVFTILGQEQYSPKRLFQYALAHYLAMKKKHWTKNGGKCPDKLKHGWVRWEIAELLHPRARIGGKIATQTKKMERALRAAEQMDEKLAATIRYTLNEIEKFENVGSLFQWEELFLILMQSFLKDKGLGFIAHTKHDLIIDTEHPDYPATITDQDQVKTVLFTATNSVLQEIKSPRNIEIMPELTDLSKTQKKVSFRPILNDTDREEVIKFTKTKL